MLQRYKLTVEYLGSAYRGFQAQPEACGPTVQAELEKALALLMGSQDRLSRVVVSSRTDAGVHAVANTAHVDLQRAVPHPPQVVRNAMNAFLRQRHQAIVVRDVEVVANDFHSRFEAIGREYIYQIHMPKAEFRHALPGRLPSALFTRDLSWHVERPLDTAAMAAACTHFLGEHDFTSFRGAKCQAPSPIRTLTTLDLETLASHRADELNEDDATTLLHVKAAAPSFLYHMVRNIVGALVDVGMHKLQPEDIPRILAAKDRSAAPAMAPAHGLYLRRVLCKPPPLTTHSTAPVVKDGE
ncbi:tRNA pseudouridine synthase A [Saprolegnia parasitica CBS 223.65]|uniref:tRNA pseudouridine synthase n=1 Tax=Saprolegnia parasitica (strain CBS 223.65) TaxID=695850 RepID=A0A067C272_SAPPC|nr:tRNA pseudouridine synthase A [Saprolegnia parasitica CBS 223.65]KDO23195.1 tRNA pseudouridine synthase A [Saprolegnia parasitica CBS 223.65]|eukprot:XP_012206146.1 tRNA pseudouridine synthase A [Saprolegnia parasitica CBS 223.65]